MVDFFGEAGGEEDGDVEIAGEIGEGVECGARAGLVVGKLFVGEAEVVGDGVDDEECEVGDGLEGESELLERGGEIGVGAGGVGEVGDEVVEVGEDVDVVEVGV